MEETFKVINRMKTDGIIEDYAIGGAIAAMFYIAPFSTEDLDVFFSVTTTETGLDLLAPIYRFLAMAGYRAEGAMIQVEGWPVQFLPLYNALIEEAVREADERAVSGVPVRVMRAEHLVAIMLQTGRPKDYARIAGFLEAGAVDMEKLTEILKRHSLENKWNENRSRFS